MNDTELDLDAIEARASEATSAPWARNLDDQFYSDAPPDSGTSLAFILAGYMPEAMQAALETVDAMRIEDAEFIAHAREDVPALVAEVRRLRAELDAR